jgi:hypothetical protein
LKGTIDPKTVRLAEERMKKIREEEGTCYDQRESYTPNQAKA